MNVVKESINASGSMTIEHIILRFFLFLLFFSTKIINEERKT